MKNRKRTKAKTPYCSRKAKLTDLKENKIDQILKENGNTKKINDLTF